MTNELACSKCGEPIKVVPAGISKKTGRPYSSFYKCKSCGNSVILGQKPIQEPAKPQMPLKQANLGENKAKNEGLESLKRIEKLVMALALRSGLIESEILKILEL